VETMVQLWPSQCSASGASSWPTRPTAHTSLELIAATAVKNPPTSGGLGVGTMVQEVPSQCGARVEFTLATLCPTAQASGAEIVVIAASWLKSLLRLGVGWMVQALPASFRS
jgi:hypothetical protein